MWKLAGVVPIPKSKDKNYTCNYRPISLLNIVSKLLEKIVYTILWEHLQEYYPLSLSQWGFQKGKSAINALLSTISDWHLFLDKRIDVLCVFFDFKKAFDTVLHGKLMQKLALHQNSSRGCVAIKWKKTICYGQWRMATSYLSPLWCSSRLCVGTITFPNLHQ